MCESRFIADLSS